MRDNLSDCVILPLVSRDSYKIMIRILHTADWHLGQTFLDMIARENMRYS